MYYTIYKITNIVNGKIYIGVHQTYNLDDEYMGSSKLVANAIKKYGKENFKKEILYFVDSEDEMYAKEAEIVTEEFVKKTDNYNIKPGGIGGWTHVNSNIAYKRSYEDRQRAAKKGVETMRIRGVSFAGKNNPFKNPALQADLHIRAQSPAANNKRKESFKRMGHQQSTKNTQYGTVWIFHELVGHKKCHRSLLADYLDQGWYKGKYLHTVIIRHEC